MKEYTITLTEEELTQVIVATYERLEGLYRQQQETHVDDPLHGHMEDAQNVLLQAELKLKKAKR